MSIMFELLIDFKSTRMILIISRNYTYLDCVMLYFMIIIVYAYTNTAKLLKKILWKKKNLNFSVNIIDI